MNLKLLLSLVTVVSLSAVVRGAILLDEKFDNPTDIIYAYPTESGGSPGLHGNFSGWAKGGGVISIKYGALLGTHGTGGMLCTVEKPSTEFMQVSYQKVALPNSDPTYITRKQLATYQLEFDACIPLGRTFTVYLGPQGPKEMAARVWGSRLVLGKVVGTGAFKRYVLSASAVSDQSMASFLQFVCDAYLNTTEPPEVSIVWNFATTEETWTAGEYFQIDNIKLATGS